MNSLARASTGWYSGPLASAQGPGVPRAPAQPRMPPGCSRSPLNARQRAAASLYLCIEV